MKPEIDAIRELLAQQVVTLTAERDALILSGAVLVLDNSHLRNLIDDFLILHIAHDNHYLHIKARAALAKTYK